MIFGRRSLIHFLVILLIAATAFAQNETTGNLVNLTSNTSSVQVNATTNETNITVLPALSKVELDALSQNCVQAFECTEFAPNQHYYACYFDAQDKSCHCFTGDISLCKNPDLKCAFEYECKKSDVAIGYNYDCTFDREDNQCQCFTGEFDLCRYEISNEREVVIPSATPPPVMTPNITVNETNQSTNESMQPAASPAIQASTLAIIVAIIIALYLIFTFTRESSSNLLRRARTYHKKAEEAHEKGDEEEAKEYMALSDKYRRKALSKKK